MDCEGGDTEEECYLSYLELLPPASEGWGKVMFSVCSHLGGGSLSRLSPGGGQSAGGGQSGTGEVGQSGGGVGQSAVGGDQSGRGGQPR